MLWSLCLTLGGCSLLLGADWPSTAGNPQRDGWSRAEKGLSKESVTQKKIQLLYKYKFDNQAHGLEAMSAPIDLSTLIGYKGFKELVFIGGSSNAVYALDSDEGTQYFKTPFEATTAGAGTVACPGGMTASLAMPGTSTPRRFGGGLMGPAVLWAVSSDGTLHTLRQQDGDAKWIAPVKFLPSDSHVTGLNVSNDVIYAATVNGCGGHPNALYAALFTPPGLPEMPGEPVTSPAAFNVISFPTNGSGFSGTGGTTISAHGTVYGQIATGHGDVAETYKDTVLALDPKTLAVKDYFTPEESVPAPKPEVESPGVTPMIFSWKEKELVVAGGRDGRLYLLDAASLGGSDHHTPLSRTEPLVATDDAFSGNGIWNTFATWEDEGPSKTRWIYAAVRGPVTMKFAQSNGATATGAIVAFKVEDQDGKPALVPQWVSRDMISPAGPATANGLLYALSSGELPRTAKKDGTPYTVAEVEKMSRHAVLYVLDATTGQELFSSGDAATSFSHSGIAFANSRVYFTTHDNTLFAYGIPIER